MSRMFPNYKRVEGKQGIARREASRYTAEAVKFLADTMRDPEADLNARLKAATALLDRSDGKPHQSIAVENEGQEIVILTEAEAAAVMLEEFGDRGALPAHEEVSEDGSNGEQS